MLAKKHRINKELFKKVFKEGKNFFSEKISVKIAPITADLSAFSFVVSSKVSKKATERNKLKRRARHIVQKIIPEIKKGLGIIIIFKKNCEKATFQEIEKEIKTVFKKAKILI